MTTIAPYPTTASNMSRKNRSDSLGRFPEPVRQHIQNFTRYLVVRKDNDPATADSYRHDCTKYIEFYQSYYDETLESLTINPETFVAFSDYLKRQPTLKRSTVKRRLTGAHRFWSYLYREKLVAYPPISMDEMDIKVKKLTNPTRPIGKENFDLLRKAAREGLATIY